LGSGEQIEWAEGMFLRIWTIVAIDNKKYVHIHIYSCSIPVWLIRSHSGEHIEWAIFKTCF